MTTTGSTTATTAPPGTIVVGVDGSKASLAALGWAVHQAELTGAAVEVVACWQWPSSTGWSPPVPDDYRPDLVAETALSEIVDTARRQNPSVAFRPKVMEGPPARALVEASADADLLVVGSRGHGEFAGMLLGSVSEHCVTNAHCPVLVYRGRA
ncbi:MAG TPA: universal stress protein [Acidimicrobiales bacterium]|nr:universal stress protein [Acidimicrobiales bacterium]